MAGFFRQVLFSGNAKAEARVKQSSLFIQESVAVFTTLYHFIFFVTYEWAKKLQCYFTLD
jgi:hypothetical protein